MTRDQQMQLGERDVCDGPSGDLAAAATPSAIRKDAGSSRSPSRACARCDCKISQKEIDAKRHVFSRATRNYYCARCSSEVGRVQQTKRRGPHHVDGEARAAAKEVQV